MRELDRLVVLEFRRAVSWGRLRPGWLVAALVLGLCCNFAAAAGGQTSSDKPVSEKKALTPQESQRQQELADDTAKLLVLANELKAELDKGSKDTLSLTVVKKAEEVEKLAHKVKEEMKKTMAE